ncbi:MAG: hypothetical protein V1663_03815 [archaeon]
MIVSLVIINNKELHVFEREGFHIFLESYADWFKTFYLNIRIVTGDVVSQNWIPE